MTQHYLRLRNMSAPQAALWNHLRTGIETSQSFFRQSKRRNAVSTLQTTNKTLMAEQELVLIDPVALQKTATLQLYLMH